MLGWLKQHSEALEGLGGLATAFATVTALIVIPYQIAQSTASSATRPRARFTASS